MSQESRKKDREEEQARRPKRIGIKEFGTIIYSRSEEEEYDWREKEREFCRRRTTSELKRRKGDQTGRQQRRFMKELLLYVFISEKKRV